MCGDGTNDVGALKHAHVGVALIANAPLQPPEPQKIKKVPNDNPPPVNHETNNLPRNRMARNRPLTSRLNEANQHYIKMLQELEEQEKAQVVKLGDASIAAPFTSKLSSIQCGILIVICFYF